MEMNHECNQMQELEEVNIYKDSNAVNFQMEVITPFRNNKNRIYDIHLFNINYCPFCGEKLPTK